jgi:hypothetical protein
MAPRQARISPPINVSISLESLSPGSQKGRRENEESRLQKMVWGGGNEQDWGTSGIGGVYKAAAFTVG